MEALHHSFMCFDIYAMVVYTPSLDRMVVYRTAAVCLLLLYNYSFLLHSTQSGARCSTPVPRVYIHNSSECSCSTLIVMLAFRQCAA